MKIVISVAAALLLLGFAHEVVAVPALLEKSRKELTGLEQKLLGAWYGEGGCVGDLNLRADGTYEQKHSGPGNNTFAGTWEVRWDALPPTLVMTCKTSDFPKGVGTKDEVKLIKLDDKALEIKYPSNYTLRYLRVKK